MPNSNAASRMFTRLALILTIAVGLGFASGPSSHLSVAAQGDANGGICGNHVLRGDYGLLASGIRPVFPAGGTEQFTATAMWTFHGNGTFTQGTGAAIDGVVTGNLGISAFEIPGNYNVNPNCTGTMVLFAPDSPFPIEYAIVIVDNFTEITGIVTSGQSNAVTVSLKRK